MSFSNGFKTTLGGLVALALSPFVFILGILALIGILTLIF